jgi:SAM-dependent methyltransferase
MASDGKHDWDVIAARDAFYGVVTADEFRADRLDPDARRRFYKTGEDDIARVLDWFHTDLGCRPEPGRALDVGCGVGRLSYAMANVMRDVVGYDVSETMVAIARKEAPANLALASRLPDGPFDWINSYIVFQHIPPAEGLDLLDDCLARAAPQAFLSLQFTGWRDGPSASASPLSRGARWLERMIHRQPGRRVDPLIRMHDYNFSDILRRIMTQGFERVVLRHTDHGGHHGAWILARRT